MTGLESEHTYTPRPADILAVQRAGVLVKVGLGLETWVEPLIRNANNPDILVIDTSEGIEPIKDNSPPDGHEPLADGHKHGKENPHVWLDPEIAKDMLRHILVGLERMDPGGASYYDDRFDQYIRRLDQLQEWGIQQVEALSDRRIVTHHAAWPYFARRFGFQVEGNLIDQVGSEPSAKKLAQLIRQIRSKKIKVIVSEPQLNQALPRMLAQETGAQVVILTPLPGALKAAEDYLSMIEYNLTELVKALDSPQPRSGTPKR